eukprot:Mrub_08000.p1 GENE.Mrub_08000~~Mrub_08000.p1  ORF type:complete len:189 (-),score=54.24 Mrub_08000:303-836(-)
MIEDNNQEQRIHFEQNIVNLDVYNTLKEEVTCRVCEEVLCRPERCRNCDYSYCSPCLQLAGRRCPNCGEQGEFDAKVRGVYRNLDRMLFSCGQCLRTHSYAALEHCEMRLCRDCNALIHRDDLLHKCRYKCWACMLSQRLGICRRTSKSPLADLGLVSDVRYADCSVNPVSPSTKKI